MQNLNWLLTNFYNGCKNANKLALGIQIVVSFKFWALDMLDFDYFLFLLIGLNELIEPDFIIGEETLFVCLMTGDLF